MSILREQRERIVIEEGPPVAVCDGCGKREDTHNIDLGYAEHPKKWSLLFLGPRPVGPFAVDLKGLCSPECLLAFARSLQVAA
jgi:hypothetical protein